MIVDCKLLNEDGLTIGKAQITMPFEDVKAAMQGLKTTGQSYTECRWIEYDIYWQERGPQECHGKMRIEPCPEDC